MKHALQYNSVAHLETSVNIPNPNYSPFLRFCKICNCVLFFNGKRGRKTEFCDEHRNGANGNRRWSNPERRYILYRDNSTCVYCGIKTNGVDHVLPVSRGGIHNVSNGVACCRLCNVFKYTKLDWRGIKHLTEKGEDMSWFKGITLGEESSTNAIHAFKEAQ